MTKGAQEKSPKVFIGFNVTFPEGVQDSKKKRLGSSDSRGTEKRNEDRK
jgi:hypothetical protein